MTSPNTASPSIPESIGTANTAAEYAQFLADNNVAPETDEAKLARLTARFEYVSTLKGRYYGIEATRIRREVTTLWKKIEAAKAEPTCEGCGAAWTISTPEGLFCADCAPGSDDERLTEQDLFDCEADRAFDDARDSAGERGWD